jgi:adenosylcobinamide-phosphate synthase
LEAALLKTTFSVRGLTRAARDIQSALDRDDLTEARRLTSWHLVSRDTASLTRSQVAAATIQSVAESTSDGIMAPLVSYMVAGLPGALAYRFANTADSMLGYRDPAREWLGKIPARWDDLLNLLPARLTALLLTSGAALSGEDARQAWLVWHRDRNRTASPNAGHPMSAMAGALGVELEKADHYNLGAGGRSPESSDVSRAVRVMRAAVALGAGLMVGVSFLRSICNRRWASGE